MNTKTLKDKKVCITGHITEIYGPVQALGKFVKKQKPKSLLIIHHPFGYSSIPKSKYYFYQNEILQESKEGPRNSFLDYLRDFVLDLWWTSKKGKLDIYFGIDNLNALAGILLRKISKVDKVIYYVIDYSPKRFNNKMLNWIYHKIDLFCVKNSDYIWNISSRIATIRKKQGVKLEKNMVVNVGIDLDQIRVSPKNIARKNILVCMSHLTKYKGIQLMIQTMQEVKKLLPAVRLEIIGTGPYENELNEMVKKLNLNNEIQFLGAMNHKKLFSYLPTCGIAIATYTEDKNNIAYYADPTKPKEYLACGLPVIITRVPWIAELIEKKPMGIAIDYDQKKLIQAIIKLSSDLNFYNLCRKNALEYTSHLHWDGIYNQAFKKIKSNIK